MIRIDAMWLAIEPIDVAVLPARPAHPRDKPKAEVGVQVVERWILARLPAGTPARHATRLASPIKEVLSVPSIAKVLEENALELRWTPREEMTSVFTAEAKRWGGIVRRLNFTAESLIVTAGLAQRPSHSLACSCLQLRQLGLRPFQPR